MLETSLPMIVVLCFLALLAWAVYSDLTTLTIPNRIPAALVLLFPAFWLAAPGVVDPWGALIVAAAVFLGGAVLFAMGAVGGGDVKLMAAVALWAGPDLAFEFLAVTSLAGGLLALILMTRLRFALACAAETMAGPTARDSMLKRIVPYAVAIAGGGLTVAVAPFAT